MKFWDIITFKWFFNLFNAMEKAWNKLTELEKKISVQASGIIAILNKNLIETPDMFFLLVQEKFPDITRVKLSQMLLTAVRIIGIADKNTAYSFEEAVKMLQTYLSTFKGNAWQVNTMSAVNALLTVLLPSTSLMSKITAVWEFVYKKKVVGTIVK